MSLGSTPRYEPIAISAESTVVAEFVAEGQQKSGYQSEAGLERELISLLQGQAYEYITFSSEEQLVSNLRKQLEALNSITFSNTTIAVTNTGTFAVQATLSAETTKVIGTVRVVGNIGAVVDAPVSGTAPANALYQGVRGATTYPTAVTDGQMVVPMADKAGRQAVVLNTVRDLTGTAVVSNNSTASGVSFIGAGAANVFNDIITRAQKII